MAWQCLAGIISSMDINTDIFIGIILALLILLVLFLRTNVALATLGLCAGFVLSDMLSDEVVDLAYSKGLQSSDMPLSSIVAIVLTLLPGVLILYRFRHFQSGRTIQQLLPALAFALLSILLVFSNVPFEVKRQLQEESVIYTQMVSLEVLITVSVIGIAILYVLMHESERKRDFRRRHKGLFKRGHD